MNKLWYAMYLISSEWDMQQCIQFLPVVGFVDIMYLEENHEKTK